MKRRWQEGVWFSRGFYIWIFLQVLAAALLLASRWPDFRHLINLRDPAAWAWGVLGGAALSLRGSLIFPPAAVWSNPASFLHRALALVLLNSIAEEIIWRGGIFNFAIPSFPTLTVFIYSLGFAAMHALPQGTRGALYNFASGIIFAALAVVSAGLLAPVVAHLLYNFIVSVQKAARSSS